MPRDDVPVAHAQRARGAHVVKLPVAQKFSPHVVRQAHPAKQAEQNQQQCQTGREHRAKDDQQIQLRHGTPDFNKALKRQIRLATKKALNRPGDNAQQGAGEGQCQRKQHTDPKPVDQLRQQIPATVVGPQPVVTGGWRRVGRFCKVVECFGAVRVRSKQRPIAALAESLPNERVKVIGGRVKVAAKGFFRVVLDHREIGLALVTHQQRPVVADDLSGQTQGHQNAK